MFPASQVSGLGSGEGGEGGGEGGEGEGGVLAKISPKNRHQKKGRYGRRNGRRYTRRSHFECQGLFWQGGGGGRVGGWAGGPWPAGGANGRLIYR